MPTPFPRIRSGLLRTVLCLFVLVLGLVQCGGEPLIILDIDPESRASVTKLLLRLQLNDGAVQEQEVEMSPNGIVVHLPEGASGTVKIGLKGLNEGGCTVALANLETEVPGGLSRATRLAFAMTAPDFPLCSLRAVLAMDSTSVIVVGDMGALFHCTDAKCSYFPSGTTANLVAAWKQDATTFYTVGAQGTMLRCSISTSAISCTALTLGTGVTVKEHLHRVWGDPFAVYVVGNNGTALRCPGGGTCNPFLLNTKMRTSGLWGSDSEPKVFYVTSGDGILQRCEVGKDPEAIISCTTRFLSTSAAGVVQPLNDVWGANSANVYAVGAGAAVRRRNLHQTG